MLRAYLLAAFLPAAVTTAAAQERNRSEGGWDLTVHALWSGEFQRGSSVNGAPGLELGLGRTLPIGVTLELRGSYRSWDYETYIPLHLGARYDVAVHPLVTLAPFAGIGPSLVWGNDWGAIFASVDLGTRAFLSLGQGARVRLSFEVAYGRGMAFHSDGFGLVNLAGGLNIGL